MKELNSGKNKAQKFYDQEAKNYIDQYGNNYEGYPANLIRLNFTIPLLQKNNIKTILDVGCGSCGPLIKLTQEGFSVKGFDFSQKMVDVGRDELLKVGFDPELIFVADLENQTSLPKEKFDAVIAYGVFPHIVDEHKALKNILSLLKDGRKAFIEFRNDLFAAYSLNKYSLDFFLNRLIKTDVLPKKVIVDLINFYSDKLKVDKPEIKKDGKILYTDILAKYWNPLTIEKDLFEPSGLHIENIHFYHFHALPPIFENKYPELFKKLSLEIEKTDDPKGYLMASAYVVEATKND